MNKRMILTLMLALGILSAALLPGRTVAAKENPRQSLATLHVPANQSRHTEFLVPANAADAAETGDVRYTLDVDNRSLGPTAPDSGYLNGQCYGVVRRAVNGLVNWQLTLTTNFQYDNFQSARRGTLNSSARGYWELYRFWNVDSHSYNWDGGGNSWQASVAEAHFSAVVRPLFQENWSAHVQHVVDSEGNCDVEAGSFPR